MCTIRWSYFISIFLILLGAHPAVAAKYAVLEGGVIDGGRVSGRIIFDGTPPPPRMVKVDEDVEACGSDDRPSEDLLVNSNGGIKNAVLGIEGIATGKQWETTEEFVYDQRQCKFIPRMLLIQPKAQGVVLNSDTVGHNFHTISKGIFSINKKIKAGAQMKVAKNKIRKPGIIRAKCDMHSWMKGWWIVAESPYTVISDENGNYSIADIPPGTYTLKLWHEVLGESEQTVVVKANESTEINVTLEL
jgi:plastocyanin